jgi:hypothetical protein
VIGKRKRRKKLNLDVGYNVHKKMKGGVTGSIVTR